MAEPVLEDLPKERAARYSALLPILNATIAGEPNRIARYATCVSLLVSAFGPRFFWCGFYIVDEAKGDELVVGPYHGTLGCLRIAFGKGVCGAAALEKRTQLVANVHEFPGHIACDSRSNSEIVVPVFDASGALAAVLDVDSTDFGAFDGRDAAGLEGICAALLTTP